MTVRELARTERELAPAERARPRDEAALAAVLQRAIAFCRCRIAEILKRVGRVAEAAPTWALVRRETPDDVWLYNNAGLEYADEAGARAHYAADLARLRDPWVLSWPPAHNQPCWCGSGRKYKKCCAAPGSTSA